MRSNFAPRLGVRVPSLFDVLAERLHLTSAAVRRHLDHLLEDGTLEAREPRTSATRGRGRPAKVFALTATGRDSLDQAYDDLAVQALRFLAETGGKEAVRQFADRRAAKIEQRFDVLVQTRPDLTPLDALVQVFTDELIAALLTLGSARTRSSSCPSNAVSAATLSYRSPAS